jgi:hypothetical protein
MTPVPNPFPIARYHFEFEVQRPLALPEYAGSALRGAFGHALKRIVCFTREARCSACALYRSCTYPAIFEPPAPLPDPANASRSFAAIPAPYVIEPPPWGARTYAAGEQLGFAVVLIGPALKQLSLLILAWQQALARGVGPGDGTALLRCVRVASDPQPIYSQAEGVVRAHVQQLPLQQDLAESDSCTLQFSTPLRLQRDGQVLGVTKLSTRDLLLAVLRRTQLLLQFQLQSETPFDVPELLALMEQIRDEKHLAWRDWTRYSSRQRQEMQLGGVVGRWTLRGPLGPWRALLQLGQWLHVGKNASFGLGHYQLLDASI